ncbi:hypothetical protein [Paenibacillus sp. Cedars]|uniref:hypothetical protein n=1 Tax=Paenibacillus sp. Cedars TaxID=1980674 RepID=UPI0011622084|nr:hypothetical protein [Paenibacillus sp. Cedars]AWP28709.1 hypothetical protein B9D94_19675 [Paenibacillus sp. Cedars]
MKKSLGLFVVFLLLLVAVVGCGSAETENKDLTLDKFIKAYQDAGIEVDPEEKPMFQILKAKDGVIFYVENQKVAIYEYASNKDAEKDLDTHDQMADWPRKGAFLLETKNEKAIEIFDSVK